MVMMRELAVKEKTVDSIVAFGCGSMCQLSVDFN
jgi:hypothetical protein